MSRATLPLSKAHLGKLLITWTLVRIHKRHMLEYMGWGTIMK